MEDCVFCKIIKGEFDSAKIYEDNDVLAFLDIKPVTKGHVLVIPKQHSENIFDISEDNLQKIIVVGKKLAERIQNVLHTDGIRLSQSNGAVAGQEIMHFHLHIIPRYKNDGVSDHHTATMHMPHTNLEELKQLSEKIKI